MRLLIVVKELSTNIIKYAGSGKIFVEFSSDEITIKAVDHGPGIENIEKAFEDGFARGRYISTEEDVMIHDGLGTGLSAVKRISDRVEIATDEEGTSVIASLKL